MGQFRRAALIVLALLACSPVTGAAGGMRPVYGVTLSLPAEAGGLRVNNASTVPMQIERTIGVQHQGIHGWMPVATEFNAVATCTRSGTTGPVSIAAGSTLFVRRWRGFSCSGQCQGTCRRNVYAGPGPFRFVVTLLPDRRQLFSVPFAMPTRAVTPKLGASFRLSRPSN